jgi:hypothetical protein
VIFPGAHARQGRQGLTAHLVLLSDADHGISLPRKELRSTESLKECSMRTGFLGSLAVSLVMTQLALAQSSSVPSSKPPPQPPLSAQAEAAIPVPPGIAKPAPSLSAVDKSGSEEQQPPEGPNSAEAGCVKEACSTAIVAPWRGDTLEYLLWWMKGSRLPSVLPGVFSPGPVEFDTAPHSGGRFTLGVPLDHDDQHLGLEGTYLFLGTRTSDVSALGVNNIAFVRPPVDVFLPPVGSPLPTRSVLESLSSRLQGAELNGVAQLWMDDRVQLDLLAGFRYFELDEGIALRERISDPSVDAIDALSTISADQFDGHNRFYGGQLGLRGEWHRGSCFVNVLGKVALGETYEVVKINGLTEITVPGGPPQAFPSGLLAFPANSGRFTHGSFAVLPEVGVRAGVDLGGRTRLFVGYDFLYLSSAARAADQITVPVMTPLILPPGGPAISAVRPAVRESVFWAQGITIGLECRY